MAQVKKTLKPSDPEVEICVNEEIKDGELQETVEKVIDESTEIEDVVNEQTEVVENNTEETTVIEEHKEGDILKAQSGSKLPQNWNLIAQLASKIDLSKLGTPAVTTNSDGIITKDIVGSQIRQSQIKNESAINPLDKPVTNYSQNHIATGKNPTYATSYMHTPESEENVIIPKQVTQAETLNSDAAKEVSDNPSNGLGIPFYLREATNFANWLQARKTAKDLKDIGYKIADVMGKMTLSTPTELSFRYNLPIHNQYDRNIAKLESSANQFNTSDASLNTAAKLDILGKSSELRNEQARLTSQAVSEQNQLHNQRKEQYNQIRAEVANKNKQIMGQAALAKLNADSAYKQEVRRLDDTLMYKYQDLLNRFGSVDSSVKNKGFQYSEQAAAARAAGNETLAKQYDELFKQTQSPGYRNYMLNNIIYGKQGTKLRSTSDMLLLNTQKSVARAIEKLNDNTMKLILKALS